MLQQAGRPWVAAGLMGRLNVAVRRFLPWLGLILLAAAARPVVGPFLAEFYALARRPFWPGPTQFESIRQAEELANHERLIFLERENQRLKAMVGLSSADSTAVRAPIIGRSPAVWWQQLTLGEGLSKGIQAGDAVVAPGGLIGLVSSTTAHTAHVTLVTDPTSRIGVWVARTSHHGLLSGLGSSRPVLRFLQENPQVVPGDVIVTSPASTLVRPGIPVGIVQGVDLNRMPAPEATVQLSAPINAVEWVEVWPHQPSPAVDP